MVMVKKHCQSITLGCFDNVLKKWFENAFNTKFIMVYEIKELLKRFFKAFFNISKKCFKSTLFCKNKIDYIKRNHSKTRF